MYRYAISGNVFRSDLEIPEAGPPLEQADSAELTIRLGPVPAELDGAPRMAHEYEVSGGSILFRAFGVARFLMEDGMRITVELERGADPASMRVYLLGSALAALLHQRQCFPLHASAVLHKGRCHAFIGNSGAGKSTTAALLSQRGLPLVSDDILVLGQGAEGGAVAMPGVPTLKLWDDSAEATGRASAAAFDAPDHRKRRMTDATLFAAGGAYPLAGLYILGWLIPRSADTELKPLPAFEALSQLRLNAHRPELVQALGQEAQLLTLVAAIAAQTPAYNLRRPMNFDTANSFADSLLRHITASS